MTRMSDLPVALVEEILFKVPLSCLSAVRCTCKTWNVLSKNQIVGKTRDQFLGFMVIGSRLCSMKFQNDGDSADLKVRSLNEADVFQVFHCDGLLLCLIKDTKWRVVWNPYLGETRWIQPIHKYHRFHRSDKYALGYGKNSNNSHLLPFYEIYEFDSDSWRVLDLSPDCYEILRSVSLKGNTYFLAGEETFKGFLLCFDFTAERFGPRLPLPASHPYFMSLHAMSLSCVRDEHLAVLYQRRNSMMEIWITTDIKPNAVSWSKFLNVEPNVTSPDRFPDMFHARSFFIDDEEKKVAVVFDSCGSQRTSTSYYQTAYIIGQGGYLKSVKFRGVYESGYYNPLLIYSYVPSLVKLQVNRRGKRKERDFID
ncbi:F-box protein At1g66490 [Eutrema salsugineum]|uniref:F-box protein At1g66490 n=1 Tax=Eutrema salsugineum TaxID=72664 RepID=UPI000CED688F|nr:F-box protein At1g66490 [Eutrema salsugineum]